MARIEGYTAAKITETLNKLKDKPLSVQDGGTGLNTIATNTLLIGNGTNSLTTLNPPGIGFLRYNGSSWDVQLTQLSLAQGGTNTTELSGKNSLLVSVDSTGNKLEAITSKIINITEASELLNSTNIITGAALHNTYAKVHTNISNEGDWTGKVLNIDKIPAIPAIKITEILPITHGGTGADNIDQARRNLGLKSVALEEVVPISMGGTSATSAEEARQKLGLGIDTVAIETCVPITKGGTGVNTFSNNSFILSDANGNTNFLNYNPSNAQRNYILASEPNGVPVWKSLNDIIQQTMENNVTNGVLSSAVGGTGVNNFNGYRVLQFLNNLGYYSNYNTQTNEYTNVYIPVSAGGVPITGNTGDFLKKTNNSYAWENVTIRNVPDPSEGIVGQFLKITNNNVYGWATQEIRNVPNPADVPIGYILKITENDVYSWALPDAVREVSNPDGVAQGYVLMADGFGGYGWQQLQIDESGNTQTIQIDLTTNDVSGILPETKGGTGVSSFTTAFNTAYNSHYKEIYTMSSYSLTITSSYNNKLIIFNGTRSGTITLPANNENIKGLVVQIFNKTNYNLTITPPQNSNCVIYFKDKGQNTTYTINQYETITLFYLGSNEWIIY